MTNELLPTQPNVTLRFDTASLEDRLLGRECAKRSHDETFDADLLKEAREAIVAARQSTEKGIVTWLRSEADRHKTVPGRLSKAISDLATAIESGSYRHG